jgi:hypothetical protein
MKRLSKFRKSEIDLGRYSKRLAESESQLVSPDRLAEAITKFIEWRAFSYWLRLVVERDGCISVSMSAILNERCPGFLEYAATFSKHHPQEPEFLWLRFLEWVDETLFRVATAQGWRHALGYQSMRDPRMDQLRAYWKQCQREWALSPPSPLPSFDAWRQSALLGT